MSDLLRPQIAAVHWLSWILRPQNTVYSLLQKVTNAERQVYHQLLVTWATVAAIDIVLSFPLGNLFGVPWNNAGFYASYFFCLMITLAVAATTAHFMLLAFRLKSNITETLIIYTTFIVYSPPISLFNLPATYRTYNLVSQIKHQHLDLWHDLKLALDIIKKQPYGLIDYLDGFAQHGALFVGLIATSLVAEMLISWYGNPRFAVYTALALSYVVAALVLIFLIGPIEIVRLYSYLE